MSSRERMTKVLGCLVLSVTAGAILLKLLQPEPLLNVTAFSLSADLTPIQKIFETRVLVEDSRWQSILIYQSGSATGNAQTIVESSGRADSKALVYHFVINNGRGAPDGRIQVSQRWVEQKTDSSDLLGRPGASAASAIRICLIGDFSAVAPGPTQTKQLKALLRSLQQRCRIPSRNISIVSARGTRTNQWRLFPLNELRESMLTNP